MRRLVVVLASLSLSLSAAAKPKADPKGAPSAMALEAAKRDWQELKHDPKRSRYRSHWLKVAGEFAAVAKRYPGSAEAPKALFDAAELYEDLSRISWIQDDVDTAVGLYQKLAKGFPKDTLADDAHVALARIYLGRKNDSDSARSELKAVLKGYPRGDMVGQAKTLLAQLSESESGGPAGGGARKAGSRTGSGDDDKPRASKEAQAVADAVLRAGQGKASEKPEAKAAEPKPQPKLAARAEPKPSEPKPAAKDATPAVKVTEVAWADAPAPKVPQRSPPIVDSAAIDGNLGADAADLDDDAPAPRAPEASARPLQPMQLGKGADKDKLAALASAVKSSDEDLPLSAQMGLKVRRVVIDAGHGGHDTGAIGPGGAKEKDVTLAVATKLAEKLRAQGLEVFLTRTQDRFVSLENRAAFANEQHADLFISVHCNAASQHSLHGVETYSLNVSADRYAVRLAARENASSERSISDLQFMLADLATRANTADSRSLAGLVQRSVVEGLRTRYGKVRDLGTKEALFYVLLGTRMPAILVEGSFISNPEEEKRLTDAQFQDQLAGSIASGVERFVGDRRALATAGLP